MLIDADIQLIYSYISVFFPPYSGKGPIVIIGSITPAAHFHLCIGSSSCDLLCHYDVSWWSQGNVLMPLNFRVLYKEFCFLVRLSVKKLLHLMYYLCSSCSR